MGWDVGPKPRSVKAFCDSRLTWIAEDGERKVLDSAMYGFTEYYAAVEHTKPDGSREVWCAVTLLHISKHELAHKGMTEHMGPFYYNCPERILDLLTPTDSESANNWREACRETIRKIESVKAMKPGTEFRFGETVYTLESVRPWRAISHADGLRYRLTRRQQSAIKMVA